MTGDIVHLDGPHPPGDWNDLMTFRTHLKDKLDDGERVIADDGYKAEDPYCVVAPGGLRAGDNKQKKKARGLVGGRHETINERVKQFKVLTDRFRHDIGKHGDCFRACVVLTQLSFNYDKAPFDLEDAMTRAGY